MSEEVSKCREPQTPQSLLVCPYKDAPKPGWAAEKDSGALIQWDLEAILANVLQGGVGTWEQD